ncbi:MAG: hypothetical protein M3Q53_01190, partial [Actinomycetota bacterium]|nr:hypothetical protein [Actinomycetota bacterium]
MGLSVISGPHGSGRELEMLDRFERALDRDPLLVVPTRDDVDRIERELCRRGAGNLLGGTVTSFPALFEEVGRAVAAPSGPVISRMQRVWLARSAARQAPLRQLRRSAEREGFAPALETLISDLQAAGLDADGLRAATSELSDGAYESELCGIFESYEQLRDGLGLIDEADASARAIAGLRTDPRAWRDRPVLLLGFDDLSRVQVELVVALGQATDVTIAITFELDRPALAARAGLRATLIDELGAEPEPPLVHRDGARTGTLRHLERQLFNPDPPTTSPDGSLHLLEGAGDRSEAELIGRQIAHLLADGSDPDDIAIAVRSPDRQAPLIARVLSGLGIPVAAEARVQLTGTATGAALLELLAIVGPDGTAGQVVSFLRGPARARPESVDWLERRVLRNRLESAADALGSWRGGELDRR